MFSKINYKKYQGMMLTLPVPKYYRNTIKFTSSRGKHCTQSWYATIFFKVQGQRFTPRWEVTMNPPQENKLKVAPRSPLCFREDTQRQWDALQQCVFDYLVIYCFAAYIWSHPLNVIKLYKTFLFLNYILFNNWTKFILLKNIWHFSSPIKCQCSLCKLNCIKITS